MRLLTGGMLTFVCGATAWAVFLPILLHGEVTYCEPITPIAWLEFGILQVGALLGMFEAVRGMKGG